MVNKFVEKYLTNVEWNLKNKQWQVAGNLSSQSNRHFKFDIRNVIPTEKGFKKIIEYNNESDKILFETEKDWVLLDTEECVEYVKNNKLSKVTLQTLLDNLDWNIVLNK